MFSQKLGAAWVVDAALSASVPLTITVILHTHAERKNMYDAIHDAFFDITPTPAAHYEWKSTMNRLEIGKAIIYFFFSNRPDELRGRKFDYIWATDVGRYDEFRRNEILFMLRSLMPKPVVGSYEENLLVTH